MLVEKREHDKERRHHKKSYSIPTRYMEVVAKELFRNSKDEKKRESNTTSDHKSSRKRHDRSRERHGHRDKERSRDHRGKSRNLHEHKDRSRDRKKHKKSHSDNTSTIPIVSVSTSSQTSSGPVSPKSTDLDTLSLMALPTSNQKALSLPIYVPTRCFYWPRCGRGSGCKFVHPSEVCKAFPNCPYKASECIFIHPGEIITLCKFGKNCSNKNCRFAHEDKEGVYFEEKGEKRKLSNEVENVKTLIPYRCRNGLFCSKSDCAYLHPGHEPLKCKFGSYCNRLDCYYQHPPPSFDAHGRPLSVRDSPIYRNPKKYHMELKQLALQYMIILENEEDDLDGMDIVIKKPLLV